MKEADKKRMKKMIKEVIRKDAREEALNIVLLSSDKLVEELIGYYKNDKYNIFCIHIDYMKSQLYKEGKIEKSGVFGYPFIDEID